MARAVNKYGLTENQENFCQRYIELGNASEAYRQSYNASNMKIETIHRSAKEVMDNRKVSARIEQLRQEHRERHNITVDSLTQRLQVIDETALELGQCSASVSATMGIAKINGLLIDKTEITGKNGKAIELKKVSDEELNAKIAELSKK